MNKRIDLTNLGGFPLEQDTLKFMQDSYDAAFQAVAKLCGNKTILAGVVNTGGVVSDGWISYNNELIPFVGAPYAAQVVISETATTALFEDGSTHNTYFTKIATCGSVGDFPFSDLVPLLSLVNVWRPGDIKERYCDNAYIAANFDTNGYGVNAEVGWRIMSKAYPDTAGKVFVNRDPADTDFNTVGKKGGEKTHTLSTLEMPQHSHGLGTTGVVKINPGAGSTGTVSGGNPTDGGASALLQTGDTGGNQAHNNMQPYYVILKLIKL